MTTWIIATGNLHKVREFEEILGPLGIGFVRPADIGTALDIEEWGETFAENAVIKALAWAQHTQRVCAADDSGLEVRALDWGPGVYSARYAGPACDDEANNAKLLHTLETIEGPGRDARYRCVIALARPLGSAEESALPAREIVGFGANDAGVIEGVEVRTFDGACGGRIGRDARGTEGFGYDPFFETSDGRHMAELTPDEKHAISHRGVALRKAAAHLTRPPE